MKKHTFNTQVTWTGNEGKGTKDYTSYSRLHEISGKEKYGPISGSSAPAFLGDSSRYNPEELLVSSVSACHMLWYLHLCAEKGIVVTSYTDDAEGLMTEDKDGSGKFSEIILCPVVRITSESKIEEANELHSKAHKMCFIANSCNFKISHKPKTILEEQAV